MNRRQNFYNEFSVPGDIFLLGLNSGELAVYTFLLRCENRKTHQCWPSYKTIGKAAGMSVNTVRKHICSLADGGLIRTENTSIITGSGVKRNGNLLYTILPIEPIVKERIQSQARQSSPQRNQQKDAPREPACRGAVRPVLPSSRTGRESTPPPP